jgi:hypothetical protein
MAELSKKELAAIQELPEAEEAKADVEIEMIDTTSTMKKPFQRG